MTHHSSYLTRASAPRSADTLHPFAEGSAHILLTKSLFQQFIYFVTIAEALTLVFVANKIVCLFQISLVDDFDC